MAGAVTRTLLGMALLLGACKREDVRAYRVPKEPAPKNTPMGGMGSAPALSPSPGAGAVTWTVPDGWKQVENTQQMRVATFRAGADAGLEVSLAAFPGDVGGMLANVNRWRGQMGLAAATEADLPGMLRSTTVGNVKVSLIRISGSDGKEMLGAIVDPGDGKTWFLKATGTGDSLTKIEPAFEAMAKSIRIGTGTPPMSGQVPVGGVPPTTPPGGAPPGAGTVEARLAAWTAPAEWNREADSSGIAAAVFSAEGQTRITATTLFGDGGGTLANVNRWRDQMGLAPLPALDASVAGLAGAGARVDLADAGQTRRMIAVIVPSGTSTWFFKLTGPVAGVEAQKDRFDAFVRAVGLGER